MNYYEVEDVMKITGLGKSTAYELIKKLNERLKKEYPGTFIIKGKVPIWFFDKKTMIKGDDIKKEN